jgi:hypothetical protein
MVGVAAQWQVGGGHVGIVGMGGLWWVEWGFWVGRWERRRGKRHDLVIGRRNMEFGRKVWFEGRWKYWGKLLVI